MCRHASCRCFGTTTFEFRVPWALDYQGITAAGDASIVELNYRATDVLLAVGGAGTVTAARDGTTTRIPVSDQVHRERLEEQLSQGLQAFSFTDG